MLGEHPDRAWLEGVISSLGAWLREPATSPTSQLTAGGAIAQGEAMLSALHGDRPTLLMPSATYALWVALRALAVGPGDEVLIPQYDWTSNLAVVLALGAKPVVVPADRATLTIDPAEVGSRRTPRTRALVATHILGVPADVPALREAVPRVPIIEDCAQALGSTLDGQPVGTLGDAAIFSFGPGKPIDVGELGALILRDEELRDQALLESAHPIRQQLGGVVSTHRFGMSIRPHPIAAALLCVALRSYNGAADASRPNAYARIAELDLNHVYGMDSRREVRNQTLLFDATSPQGAVLADTVGYREIDDIGSVLSGQPKLHRVGIVAVPAEPDQ